MRIWGCRSLLLSEEIDCEREEVHVDTASVGEETDRGSVERGRKVMRVCVCVCVYAKSVCDWSGGNERQGRKKERGGKERGRARLTN